jgi:hypothetical protein
MISRTLPIRGRLYRRCKQGDHSNCDPSPYENDGGIDFCSCECHVGALMAAFVTPKAARNG